MKTAEDILKEKRRKASKKKLIKRIVIYVLILTFIIFGLFAYNTKLKEDRWPWQKPVVESPLDSMVQTKVYENVYKAEIDVSGYVQAYDTQAVVIRADGAVTGVFVKEGDRVKKGDLLATIDSTNQTYNVSSLEWQIEKAKISKTTSEKDIELLEMRLDTAKQQLENTKAYALFDGVVVSVSIEEGDYSTPGAAVMTIIDDSRLKATVEVDEIDVQMLEKGMKCILSSDSVLGQVIEGYVSYIPMIGRYSTSGIGVMDVEIVIDNPPAGFKPGFSFEGVIDVENEQKMLLVSQSAVTTQKGVSTLTKLHEDGTMEVITVQVKYLGENLYQIISGDVKDGDTVVYKKSGTGLEGMMSRGGRF